MNRREERRVLSLISGFSNTELLTEIWNYGISFEYVFSLKMSQVALNDWLNMSWLTSLKSSTICRGDPTRCCCWGSWRWRGRLGKTVSIFREHWDWRGLTCALDFSRLKLTGQWNIRNNGRTVPIFYEYRRLSTSRWLFKAFLTWPHNLYIPSF